MTAAQHEQHDAINTIEASIEAERFALALAKSEGEEDLYVYTDMIEMLEEELHEAKHVTDWEDDCIYIAA